MADTSSDAKIDEIMSRIYRRFEDWNTREFSADDVTWCEVRADILAIIDELVTQKNGVERIMFEIIEPRRIAKEFALYRITNVGAAARADQVADAQRAFYAGAWALYQLLMRGLEPNSPTPANLRMVLELAAEMQAFQATIEQPRRAG